MTENGRDNNFDPDDEDGNHLLAEQPQLIQENNEDNQNNSVINDELSEIQENENDLQFSKKIKHILIIAFPSIIFVNIQYYISLFYFSL